MIVNLEGTDTLVAVMAAAPAANQPVFMLGCSPAGLNPVGVLTGITEKELMEVPGGAGDGVQINSLLIYNKDTAEVQVTVSKKVSSTNYAILNRVIPAGGTLYMSKEAGIVVTSAAGTAAATVGASAQPEVTAAESGDSTFRKTVLTLTDMPITITDALAYVGKKLYDFPAGRIQILSCVSSLAFTTTSAIASTLNSGVTVSYGLGSVTASATTLATTMQNFMPGSGETPKTFTSSTTIDVASATVTGFLAAVAAAQLAAILDGTGTAIDLFLNLAVPTGTDIDADATLTVSGTITIHWINEGDV